MFAGGSRRGGVGRSGEARDGCPGSGGRRPSPRSHGPGYLATVTTLPRSRLPAPLALVALALLAAAACAGGPRPGDRIDPDYSAVGEAPRTQGERPLAGLVGQRVILFPVQRLAPTADAAPIARDPQGLLRQLDGELAFALEERALAAAWTDPTEVVGMARRNPAYGIDPLTMPIPAASAWRAGDPVREPVGSQLRALAALGDTRWAVVPLELRLAVADGTPRAVLRLALVDVRTAQVLWVGETAGATVPAAELPGGLAAAAAPLAARTAAQFTDLIVAPREP